MTDFVIIAVLAMMIAMAARYLYKAKKNGAVCVGCPSGGCSGCAHTHPNSTICDCGGSCGCHENNK